MKSGIVSVTLGAIALAGCGTFGGPRSINSASYQAQPPAFGSGSPLQSVCHLYSVRGGLGSEYTGSAVLYRGRYLLTAGHNVYQDKKPFTSLKRIDIQCGNASAQSATVAQTVTSNSTIDAAKYDPGCVLWCMPFNWDFGMIRLNEPIEVETPFVLAKADWDTKKSVMLAGYPFVKGSEEMNGRTLYHATGSVTLKPKGPRNEDARDGLVNYNIETHGSNSGGPVWQDVDGVPTLVAIHVRNGGGRTVDDDFIREVGEMKKELDRRASVRASE